MTALQILALVAPVLAVAVVAATACFEIWLDNRAERRGARRHAAE
jgi:hypothetical protein